MNKNELKEFFLLWIKQSSNALIPQDPFVEGALNAAIDVIIGSTYNGMPFIDYYSPAELYHRLLRLWRSHCVLLLPNTLPKNLRLTIFGAQVPTDNPNYRNELQLLFSQLENECLS